MSPLTLGWLLLSIGLVLAQEQDVEGSKDHPFISRYPGSIIRGYYFKEFDEFILPLSKLTDGKPEKRESLEGKVTRITYEAPKERSIIGDLSEL